MCPEMQESVWLGKRRLFEAPIAMELLKKGYLTKLRI